MPTRGTHAGTPSRLSMARSRGAISGPLLMLLGAWGALVPFIGHSFGYGFTPNNTWTWTVARGWLEVAPGAAAFVGGAILTTSAHRATATLAGWLAGAAGAWFVLGTVVSPWWNAGFIGTPTGSTTRMVWERIGMFDGLGVLVVLFAGLALGRVSVIGVRDVAVAQRRLDAYRTIEDAPVYPGDTTSTQTTTKTTKTQPVSDGERSLHDSHR